MMALSVILLPAKPFAQNIPGVGVVTGLAKKVIKAIDLKVQRLQNKTIGLQNAQKLLENTFSKLHLQEITGWVQQQKDLYANYYNELWRVKSVITYYHRIKEITQKQKLLLSSYQRAWALLKNDKNFSVQELDYMTSVYSGILERTMNNINEIVSVVKSFSSQMDDAARLQIINKVSDEVDENYSDLQRFNTQNYLLSLQRNKAERSIKLTQWMSLGK